MYKKTTTSSNMLALGSPVLGSSRYVWTYYRIPRTLISSAAIHFTMKRSAPCPAVLPHSPWSWAAVVHWSALIPKALRSSRGHPIHFFFGPSCSPCPPPVFRTPRTSAVSCPPYVAQIPRTGSASCAWSPRCSHFPSPWGCPVTKLGGRLYCSFTNQYSQSGSCSGLGVACRNGTRAGSTWRSRKMFPQTPQLLASGFWARALVRSYISRVYFIAYVTVDSDGQVGIIVDITLEVYVRTLSFAYTPDQLPLHWIWWWTPVTSSCVNTLSQSWPPIRRGQQSLTRPWSPSSSSSAARAIARRPWHCQRKSCPKVTPRELALL